MRAMISLAACLCTMVGVSCSGEAPRPASDQRQLVVFSTGKSENIDSLRQRIKPSQTTAVDAAGTQMWSVDAADVTELREMMSTGRIAQLHVEANDAWPMLREITTSSAHADAIRSLIGTAPQTSYVIGRLPREVPLSAAIDGGFLVSVPLPGGDEIELLRPRQVETRSWQFEIDGGMAAITTTEAGLRGTIQSPRGVFLIRPLPNGDHIVYEPQRPTVPDEPPLPPRPKKNEPNDNFAAALDVPPPAVASCPDDTLRVLPLYTSQVETVLPNPKIDTIANLADDAEKNTKLALAENKLTLHIDVLAPVRVTFNHTKDLLTEVANLRTRANRATDEIGKLRGSTSADLIMLFSTATNACGAVLPEVMQGTIARPDQAFFVVTPLIPACAFTFTHELSHVLGMRHHDDKISAAEPLAYGFCEAANKFSTITATYTSCLGTRRLLWSDPNATVDVGQGTRLVAGDKARHWEASLLPGKFKAAAAFHCAAR